jgi:prepilin-type processing-associated H-X9-DG protein
LGHGAWATGELYRCPAYPEANRPGIFAADTYSPPEEVMADRNKSRQMEARRHLGRFNVGFIDNHIERSKPEWLFAATDEGMSRWNNDHQPHRDDLYNWGE